MEIIREMRGMKRQEIIKYFSQQEGLTQDGAVFFCETYRIEVQPEGCHKIGSLTFPSTVVMFTGEEAEIRMPLKRFEINFMTAGG